MAYDPQFLQRQGQGQYSAQPGGFSNYGMPLQRPQQSFFDQFLWGTPGGYEQTTNYDPQQLQAFQQLLSGGMQNQQNPYEGFDPLAQETMNNYYQNILPGIKEQFAGQRGGALSSPDFGSQLSSSASGLGALLNAQKVRYGQQNKQFGFQQSQLGLTPKFQNEYIEGSQGAISQLLPLLAEAGMLYATGGLSGAEGLADLFGKGVGALKGLGKKSAPQSPIASQQQSAGQYQGELNKIKQMQGQFPSLKQGYGQTSFQPY